MEKNNNGFVPLTECELEETNGGFGDPFIIKLKNTIITKVMLQDTILIN